MGVVKKAKIIFEKYPKLNMFCAQLYYLIKFNRISVKGKNNKIIKSKAFLNNCKIIVKGDNNIIDLGKICYLKKTKISVCGNNNKLTLGEKDYINSGDFCLEDNNNDISIGDRTTFAGRVHLAATEGKRIGIGSRCLFSANVIVRTGDSHSIFDSSTSKRINMAKDVIIGNHVWVAYGVSILKGVLISDDSVVGTASVVTNEFKNSNVIIAGSPAKEIRKNITWDNERK